MTYDGDPVKTDWEGGVPAHLHSDVPQPPGAVVVECSDYRPVVLRRGGAHRHARWPWRATESVLTVLELSRPLRQRSDGRLAAAGSWERTGISRYDLVAPGVWRNQGLQGRRVEEAGAAAPTGEAPSVPGHALHADHRTREVWSLLPEEVQRLADRLCPRQQGMLARGASWLSSAGRREGECGTGVEHAVYLRVAGSHVVALAAQRSRLVPVRSDASDAGPWDAVAMGGPSAQAGVPGVGSGEATDRWQLGR